MSVEVQATPFAAPAGPAARPGKARRVRLASPLKLWAALAAGLAVLPLIAVVILAATGEATAVIAPGTIGRYAATSAALAGLVALGAGTLGTFAAWLVAMHRFPGRDLFAWALALPLAAPAFALAYAYADLFDVAGPIRTAARTAFGADLPLEMRSLWGAAFVLSAAFYPYVYLTARAAFVNQSVCALEAARTLGCSHRSAFLRVALPLARPAIAAGLALTLMETLADYGAVNFLGVQTLTTGVVRAWSVFGSAASAARIALVLLVAAGALLWIERWGRRGRGFAASSARWRELPTVELTGANGIGALLFCLLLVTLGLLLPGGWLLWKGLGAQPEWPRLIEAGVRSLGLAGAGAIVTVLLAGVIAFAGGASGWMGRLASLGYATPGAVIAVGLLGPAGFLWRGVEGAASGFGVGVALLLYAYAARLSASALEPMDSGLQRIGPSVTRAARMLGETPAGVIRRVQIPLSRSVILTAALLVFVDVLKELPATLILRPFDFDTLGVLADRYANDERLAQASWPALMVVVAALPCVIWLTRRIARSRPGAMTADGA